MAKFEARRDQLYLDGKKVLKGWESATGWYWFATEDHGDHEYDLGDKSARGREYFGFVQGFEEEWGNWTTAEFDPLVKRGLIWEIKPRDLPYAGRRGGAYLD